MSYKDRLQTAALTFPNGERFEFDYQDVETTLSKKTSKYTFSDTPGALVQDFGLGIIGLPIIAYVAGEDYDIDATNFEISASESGVSVFEHPVYGIRNVVIENITRSDAIKSAGGQAIFNLVITETIIATVPEAALETRNLILKKQDDFFDTNAAAFDEGFGFDTINDLIAAKDRIQGFVNDFVGVFNTLTNTVTAIQDAFNAIESFINDNIDALMQAPLQLANAIQRLIDTPARIKASINIPIYRIMQEIVSGKRLDPII